MALNELIIIEQNRETHEMLGRLLKGQFTLMATLADLDVEIQGELGTAVQTIVDLVTTLEAKIEKGDDTSSELASLKSIAARLTAAVPAVPTPPAPAADTSAASTTSPTATAVTKPVGDVPVTDDGVDPADASAAPEEEEAPTS